MYLKQILVAVLFVYGLLMEEMDNVRMKKNTMNAELALAIVLSGPVQSSQEVKRVSVAPHAAES